MKSQCTICPEEISFVFKISALRKKKQRLTRMLYRWGWSCRILQEKTRESVTTSIIKIAVMHTGSSLTYLTDKLSTRNQSQWGYDGRSMQLCSPHVQAVAAPAVNVAQSQAGTPTVEKTPSSTQSSPFDRNMTEMILSEMWIFVLYSHQKVLCQGKFMWYLEVQSSSYIASLQNKHLKVNKELGI